MAVFPVSGGSANYGSDGTSRFISQIWSAKMQQKFYLSTVFGEIANTEYEGEIKKAGDTVRIRTVPDLTIRTYTKGQSLTYEQPESAYVDLLIDKGKYWAFSADDVDKRQADIAFVEKFSDDAGEQMKIAIDSDVLNGVYGAANASNIGATAGVKSGAFDLGTTAASEAIDKTNVLDYIVDCGSVLTEQNVPETDRWMVIPTWFANMLKKSDLKDASMTGDTKSTLRNGRLGMIDNFTLYVSNNYTGISDTNTCYNVLFGHKSAITFASQIVSTEKLRNPSSFGDLIRGLNVYGYKVVVPKALGVLYCHKG